MTDSGTGGKAEAEIEVTPEMAEAGCWVLYYWRDFAVEPNTGAIAENVFNVMQAVASGRVTLDQVEAEPPVFGRCWKT